MDNIAVLQSFKREIKLDTTTYYVRQSFPVGFGFKQLVYFASEIRSVSSIPKENGGLFLTTDDPEMCLSWKKVKLTGVIKHQILKVTHIFLNVRICQEVWNFKNVGDDSKLYEMCAIFCSIDSQS